MYKMDLDLDNIQCLLCHKANQTKSYIFNIHGVLNQFLDFFVLAFKIVEDS